LIQWYAEPVPQGAGGDGMRIELDLRAVHDLVELNQPWFVLLSLIAMLFILETITKIFTTIDMGEILSE